MLNMIIQKLDNYLLDPKLELVTEYDLTLSQTSPGFNISAVEVF